MHLLGLLFSAVVSSLVALGCSPKAPQPETASQTAESTTENAEAAETPAKLIAKGRATYMSVCIACHNMDPKKSGALGPDIAGSSFELLEKKVLLGKYPDGYTPKRATNAMVPLPQMKDSLKALEAYLNSVK